MVPRSQYYAATSLDGFLADEHDGLDWLLQFGFDEFTERYERFMAGVGAIVMGARTYEFVVGGGPEAWTYGSTPCWVLTHQTIDPPAGSAVQRAEGDVRDIHRAATDAAGGRNVWMMGGGDVAAQFARHGLVDELILTVMPVVLGSGKPLLPGVRWTRPMELADTHRYPSGAVELTYRVEAGA